MRSRRNVAAASFVLCAMLMPTIVSMTLATGAFAQVRHPGFLPAATPIRGFLRASGIGYLVEDPVPIASGNITQYLVSPDGRLALLLRETLPRAEPTPLPGRLELLVWNASTGSLKTAWSEETTMESSADVSLYGWLGVSGRALLRVLMTVPGANISGAAEKSRRIGKIFLIDPVALRVTETDGPPDRWFSLNASDTVPFAAIGDPEGAADPDGVRFLDASSQILPPIPLPGQQMWLLDWVESGHVLLAADASDRFFAIDPKKRTVTQIPRPASLPADTNFSSEPDPTEKLTLRLQPRPGNSRLAGTPAAVYLTAADNPAERVLLAAHADSVCVLPGNRAALLRIAGVLFACRLSVLKSSEFWLRRAEWQARDILSALRRYRAGHDSRFPETAAGLASELGPYLDDLRSLDNFRYTPPAFGERGPAIRFGEFALPAGRAELWNDGVRWLEKPA